MDVKDYRVALFGGSGQVGSLLLDFLVRDPNCKSIQLFVRKPQSFESSKIKVIEADFSKLENYAESLKVDRTFICLGTTIKKAGSKENFRKIDFELVVKISRLSSILGVPHLFVVSSIGANPDSSIFYLRVKGEMEREILSMPFRSISIFRPSLLMGDRKEFRFMEKLGGIFLKSVSGFLPKRWRPLNATHLAESIWRVSDKIERGKRIFESEALHGGLAITDLLDKENSHQEV